MTLTLWPQAPPFGQRSPTDQPPHAVPYLRVVLEGRRFAGVHAQLIYVWSWYCIFCPPPLFIKYINALLNATKGMSKEEKEKKTKFMQIHNQRGVL